MINTMKKNRKYIFKRLKEFRTYILLILISCSIWFQIRLIRFGMIDYRYLVLSGVLLIAANLLVYFLLFRCPGKWKQKFLGRLLGIFLIVCLSVSAAGMQLVDSFLGNMTGASVTRKDFSIVVLSDSKLQSVEDISSSVNIGYEIVTEETGADRILEESEEKFQSEPCLTEYESLNAEIDALYGGQVDAVLLNESCRDLVRDERENFDKETRVVYSVGYDVPQKNISRKIDVSEEPFLVLISGIDTYGTIDTVSRSDVNILAAVDPAQGRILLISIPRDYYVPIIAGSRSMAGKSGSMDKLTHSGLFGAECTVRTVENLFDTEINYYIKVNFTGVVDIVDAIGGITVESDYAFDSFQVGSNECTGEQALSFARNRYAFQDGDRQRGKNQMKVIEAVVNKVSGFSLDYDYASLLNAVSGNVEMNFSDREIKQLIRLQAVRHPAWSVESISVTGTDGTDYSYFYGSDLYVMYPDESSVNSAKEKIEQILGTDDTEEIK